MKGLKCLGLLILSIIFLQFLNLSSDVSAITLTTEMAPTGQIWENERVQCNFGSSTWLQNTATSPAWTCNNYPSSWNGDINGIRTVNTYPVIEGNYYQLQLILRNPNNVPDLTVNPIFWNFSQSNDFTSITLEEFYVDNKQTTSTCQYSYRNSQIQSTTCDEHRSIYNNIYTFTVRAKSTGNVRFQVGGESGVLVSANVANITGSSNYNYTFGLKKIVEFEPSGSAAMNEKDDEDRSNIESQSSQAQGDADDSGSEAESTGTTLLGAFSAFVTALTNASPSNCSIDMDLGNLDLGNVDLCDLDPPAGFQSIASIFMILFCVPLSIATARKVINLFRSFQT